LSGKSEENRSFMRWEEIKRKYGSALTPEDHDRIVESALKAMVE